MILPDKNIKLANSLVGVGSSILSSMNRPYSISSLWEKSKHLPEVNNFEKFVLAVDFLYLLDLIEIKDSSIKKKND